MLTPLEFDNCRSEFEILGITYEQAKDKGHEDLRLIINRQYKRLSRNCHPDRTRSKTLEEQLEGKEKFFEIRYAYEKLCECCESFALGNGFICSNIGSSDGRLTRCEFNYRKKLFERLNMTAWEVVGKNYDEIIHVLVQKFTTAGEVVEEDDLTLFNRYVDAAEKSIQGEFGMLIYYIIPLSSKKNLITRDKKELLYELASYKINAMSISFVGNGLLLLLTSMIIIYHVHILELLRIYNFHSIIRSLIGFVVGSVGYITIFTAHTLLHTRDTWAVYEDQIVQYGYILDVCACSFAAVSVCLIALDVIFYGLNTRAMINGSILLLTYVLNQCFANSCRDYIHKRSDSLGLHLTKLDILNAKNKSSLSAEAYADQQLKQHILSTYKEEELTKEIEEACEPLREKFYCSLQVDLLKCDLPCGQFKKYDPRRLLMPIMMSFIKKCLSRFEGKVAERNFDTEIFDPSVSQPLLKLELPQKT